jgi:hypothetical protein
VAVPGPLAAHVELERVHLRAGAAAAEGPREVVRGERGGPSGSCVCLVGLDG